MNDDYYYSGMYAEECAEAEAQQLAEAESESNFPIKYYKRGGVTYAVHGTSSINFVERLLAEIADLTAVEADRKRREVEVDNVRGSLEAQPDGTIHFEEYQQPAEGEEILVNAAHDVYTLPLQPSGLSSGPRFVVHVPGPEQRAPHPATTHCDNCGCDWLDNGLNPVDCPYCKWTAWRAAFIEERALRYRESGMAIEQTRIHAETDAVLMEKAIHQQGDQK
jgi:hypothetical protein